jgi:tryptophan-rich sensory protein
MSDLQLDVLAAFIFIGWPIYNLLVEPPHRKKDDTFYTHLTVHSSVFPRHRIIFPVVWTVLDTLNGIGAYLFWHAYAPGDDNTFVAGFILYLVYFVFHCGWYNMFFRRRMLKLAFFVTLIPIWGGAVGYFVCTIIYPQIFAAVAAGLLVLWLTYATFMTLVAAFFVEDHRAAAADVALEPYSDYEQNNAQVTGGGNANLNNNMTNAATKFSAVPTASVGNSMGTVQRKGPLQLPK